MADRMKESLFSALGDVEGAVVLDLYAGSGSLGLEALSRGARSATFVENGREAIVKLEQNIEATGMEDRSEILWAEVASTISRFSPERCNLIFVDPPYSMSVSDVQRDLESIVMNGFLADDGRVVVHRPMKESRLSPLGLELQWERDFGESHLYIFCHEEEQAEDAG